LQKIHLPPRLSQKPQPVDWQSLTPRVNSQIEIIFFASLQLQFSALAAARTLFVDL
jgi:hypothetical protein